MKNLEVNSMGTTTDTYRRKKKLKEEQKERISNLDKKLENIKNKNQ